MSNLLEILLTSILGESLEWYQRTVLEGFTRYPTLLLSMILTYVFIQFFCVIIPHLRHVLNTLALPFRYMHVWLHVDAAKKVDERNKKEQAVNDMWAQWRGKDSSHISLQNYSTRDAWKIASAPLKGALALLLFIILSSPILAKMGLLGVLIHIYLIFSCFGVALPSLSDYSFLYHGTTVQPASFSPVYVLWVYFIFAISGYITLSRTGSPVSAIRDGILFSGLYLISLFLLARFITPKTPKKIIKLHFFNTQN